MAKEDNIHIRLEISKDPSSGDITLLTRFDANAPNFIKDETGFKWFPTPQERAFLNEAFDMITKRK